LLNFQRQYWFCLPEILFCFHSIFVRKAIWSFIFLLLNVPFSSWFFNWLFSVYVPYLFLFCFFLLSLFIRFLLKFIWGAASIHIGKSRNAYISKRI
jgi:hypothetical protein